MNPGREIGTLLRNTRTAAGKSLEEMSTETQINVMYLREIEEGGQFSLPDIYRTTFVRTYAKSLGLDLEELYEAEAEEAAVESDPPDFPQSALPQGPAVESPTAAPIFSNPFSDKYQIRTMAIVVIFLLTALILAVKWLGPGSGSEAVPDPASQEQSSRARPGENLSAFNQDRQARGAEPTGGAGAMDSLILVATSTESVWVHIVIDNDSAVEYTMPPNYSVTLRAAENFLLAVGNPAGLSISLNGRRLDILGDGNRPKKNILLSRKTLVQ